MGVETCCDECGNKMDHNDSLICDSCFEDVKNEKEELEEEVTKLKDDITDLEEINDDLEKTLEECKSNCNCCIHRYECVVVKGKYVKPDTNQLGLIDKVLEAAKIYSHAKDREESKVAKLKLFEAVGNLENSQIIKETS